MNCINLDYGTSREIWEKSMDVLFKMNATDNDKQCCVFKVLGKRFEFCHGELFFTGKKVTMSTFDSVCICILARIGFMDFLRICGASNKQKINCKTGPNNMKIEIKFEKMMKDEEEH